MIMKTYILLILLAITFNAIAQSDSSPRNMFQYYNEFVAHVNADVVGRDMFASNSGSGANSAAVQPSADNNVVGCVLSTTGTTATGRACLISGASIARFGGGAWVLETRIDSISALSDATNRYQLAIGFIDNNTSALSSEGAYFLYDEGTVTTGSAASANWQCVTADNTTRTHTTGTTAVAVTGAVLRIEVNADGTEVVFYVDGTEQARHSTNIPRTFGREFGFGWVLIKSAGGTARTMAVDYFYVECRYNQSK